MGKTKKSIFIRFENDFILDYHGYKRDGLFITSNKPLERLRFVGKCKLILFKILNDQAKFRFKYYRTMIEWLEDNFL